MTKVINGSIFYATSITFTKYSYFYACFLYSLFSFVIPQINLNFRLHAYIFNALSTSLLPVILTVHYKIS